MFDTTVSGVDGSPVAARGGAEGALAEALRRWWLAQRPGWVHEGWYGADVDPEVRALMMLPPGPALAAALHRLSERRGRPCPQPHPGEAAPGEAAPGRTPGDPCLCQIVVCAAWAALSEWAANQAARDLAAAAGHRPDVRPARDTAPQLTDPAREELAVALRLSPDSVRNRVATARTLAALPGLLDAVDAGLLSGWTARTLAAELDTLTAEQADTVITELLDRIRIRHTAGIRAWTCGELRRLAKRLRLTRYPDTAGQDAERARLDRKVTIEAVADGMAYLTALLPGADAVRIHRRLTAIAAGLDDPTRSRDQKRADTLVDLLLATPAPGGQDRCSSPAPGGGSPAPAPAPEPAVQVKVVVPLATLLGLTDDCADLAGYGPIDAATARELAADGAWQAWITDPAGRVTAVGSRRYTPPPALAALIRARQPHCRMPGCRRPAETCDLDHTIPWPRGSTEAANLGPLCRRHHNLKTHHGWQLTNHPDGTWTWHTPRGTTVVDQPEPPL